MPVLYVDAAGNFQWINEGDPVPSGFVRADGSEGAAGAAGGGGASATPFQAPAIPGFVFDRSTGKYFIAGTSIPASAMAIAGALREQPGAPEMFTDPATGDLVGRDPQTGEEVFRIPGVSFAQESPEQKRQREAQAAQEQRDFTTSEREARQRAAADVAATTQQSSADQSALDRALSAAQFAQQYGLSAEQFAFTQQIAEAQFNQGERAAESAFNRFEQDRARQLLQDRLSGAEQFASLVSLTDPAALPAFFEAGGGVISNALAGGADALSENALLPAARTLRGLETFNPPPSLPFERQQFPVPFQQQVEAPAPPPPLPPQPGQITVSPELVGTDIEKAVRAQEALGRRDVAAKLALPFGTFAPKISAANGFNGIVGQDGPVQFEAGENGLEKVQVTPLDEPFVNRVRNIRTSVKIPQLFGGGGDPTFQTRFNRLPPSLIQRFLRARQSVFGIPVADQAAEINRFALPGIGRGSLAFAR